MARRHAGTEDYNPNDPGNPPGVPVPMWPGPIEPPEADPVPIAHWVSAAMPVVFTAAPLAAPYSNAIFGPTAGVTNRAIVTSPIFDLRPDLGGSYRPTASKIPGAARLHWQFNRNDGLFIADLASTLEVYSVEFAHVVNPDELRAIEERMDITSDFYQGTQSTLLEWAPPGAPVRFWRVSIVFDWFDGAAAPPALTAWGSAH